MHCNADELFVNINKTKATVLILDIMEEICKSTDSKMYGITKQKPNKKEDDGIEYFAGYCLFKAKKKFPQYIYYLENLEAENPNGELIKIMEKHKLEYPAEHFFKFMQRIFSEVSFQTLKTVHCKDLDFF